MLAHRRAALWSAGILVVAAATLSLAAIVTTNLSDSLPPTSAPTRSQFPSESDTGVPAGTILSNYSGPCTIDKSGTILDSQRVHCEPLTIAASGITISRSRLGPINMDGEHFSASIVDSEIDAGSFIGPAIGYANISLLTSEVRGGQHSVLCSRNCLIERSLLHDQSLPAGEARHNNAFLSNGGDNIAIRHNTLQCTPPDNAAGGGCSADLSLFGDFEPITNVTIDDNLFRATPGAFCLRLGYDPSKTYGSKTARVVVRNNVFERGPTGQCGTLGPVTSAPSDLDWASNSFDDAATLEPP